MLRCLSHEKLVLHHSTVGPAFPPLWTWGWNLSLLRYIWAGHSKMFDSTGERHFSGYLPTHLIFSPALYFVHIVSSMYLDISKSLEFSGNIFKKLWLLTMIWDFPQFHQNFIEKSKINDRFVEHVEKIVQKTGEFDENWNYTKSCRY